MIEWDLGLVGIGEVSEKPIPITLVVEAEWSAWCKQADTFANAWIESVQFLPKTGKICLIPGPDGRLAHVVVGLGSKPDFWGLAALPRQLPRGRREAARRRSTGQRASDQRRTRASTKQGSRWRNLPTI